MTWDRVLEIAGTIAGLGGLLWKQAHDAGKGEERMDKMSEDIAKLQTTTESHETRLADGAVNFGKIDVKLDNISETTKETRDLLIEHLKESRKS